MATQIRLINTNADKYITVRPHYKKEVECILLNTNFNENGVNITGLAYVTKAETLPVEEGQPAPRRNGTDFMDFGVSKEISIDSTTLVDDIAAYAIAQLPQGFTLDK